MKRVEACEKPYEEMLDLMSQAVQLNITDVYPEDQLLEAGRLPFKNRDYMARVLKADAKNYISAVEFVKSHSYFFLKSPKTVDSLTIGQEQTNLVRSELLQALQPLDEKPGDIWNHDAIASAFESAFVAMLKRATHDADGSTTSLKKKDIWRVVRAMLTGGEKGPSLVETMEILGYQIVTERIRAWKQGEKEVYEMVATTAR